MSTEITDTDRLEWLIKCAGVCAALGEPVHLIVEPKLWGKERPNLRKIREYIDEEIRNESFEI